MASLAGLKAKLGILRSLADGQSPVVSPMKPEEVPSVVWRCRDIERKTARCDEEGPRTGTGPRIGRRSDGQAIAFYRELLAQAKELHANDPEADGGGMAAPGVWGEWIKTYSWRIALLSSPIKKRLAYLKSVRDQLPKLASYEVRDIKDILTSIEDYASEEKAKELHLNFKASWYRELDTEIAELENAKH